MAEDVVGDPVLVQNSAVPKHQQLKGILVDLVAQMEPGDVLPGERQLCTDHGVSRITVREAIGQLVAEGVLVRSQGKGTFVAHRPMRSQLHLASFHQDMARMGFVPSTVVLSAGTVEAPAHVAEALALGPAGRACRLRRVRRADGRPIAYEEAWYSDVHYPGLADSDLGASVYDLLARRYGRPIERAEQTVQAQSVDARTAGLLEVPAGSPVLFFVRVGSSRGVPVEHTSSWYRGDRYELLMTLDDAVSGQPTG